MNIFSTVGRYELWVSEDGGHASLFMPKNQTDESYLALTTDLGYGDGEPEWEGDHQDDRSMLRVASFWSPGFWFAKLMRDRLMDRIHSALERDMDEDDSDR